MEIEMIVTLVIAGITAGLAFYKSMQNRGNKSMLNAVVSGLDVAFHGLDDKTVKIIKSDIKYASWVLNVAGRLDTLVHGLRKTEDK